MALTTGPDELVLLHNPRCSKSRALEVALAERGLAVRVRRYLDEPLVLAEVTDLFGRLGRPGIECVRHKESAFAEAGLSDLSPDEEVARAIVVHPVLLERPILIQGPRAAIGRPTEDALALLEG
jgi:arsenate reductase